MGEVECVGEGGRAASASFARLEGSALEGVNLSTGPAAWALFRASLQLFHRKLQRSRLSFQH